MFRTSDAKQKPSEQRKYSTNYSILDCSRTSKKLKSLVLSRPMTIRFEIFSWALFNWFLKILAQVPGFSKIYVTIKPIVIKTKLWLNKRLGRWNMCKIGVKIGVIDVKYSYYTGNYTWVAIGNYPKSNKTTL